MIYGDVIKLRVSVNWVMYGCHDDVWLKYYLLQWSGDMWKNYQVSAVSWCLVSGTMNNEATISVWVTVGRGCSIFRRQWSRWVTLLVTPSSPHPWKLALVHPSVHQRRGLRTFPHSDDSDSEIRASNEGSRRFHNHGEIGMPVKVDCYMNLC